MHILLKICGNKENYDKTSPHTSTCTSALTWTLVFADNLPKGLAYIVRTSQTIHRTSSFSTETTNVSSWCVFDTTLLLELFNSSFLLQSFLFEWLKQNLQTCPHTSGFFFLAHLVNICVLLHVTCMRSSDCMWNYETQPLEPKIQAYIITVNRDAQMTAFLRGEAHPGMYLKEKKHYRSKRTLVRIACSRQPALGPMVSFFWLSEQQFCEVK